MLLASLYNHCSHGVFVVGRKEGGGGAKYCDFRRFHCEDRAQCVLGTGNGTGTRNNYCTIALIDRQTGWGPGCPALEQPKILAGGKGEGEGGRGNMELDPVLRSRVGRLLSIALHCVVLGLRLCRVASF